MTIPLPLATGAHSVDVDGVEQRYHVHGTGPVCIAHPGGPGVSWEYLRMPEVERRLTVVYPEPVGTGQSDELPSHPHGYTRARYSRFLGALVDHLGVREVHLLGHSHGGFVVQYHALHHPEKVAGIILYESAALTGPEHVAEAARLAQSFMDRNAERPEIPDIVAAFDTLSAGTASDAQLTAVARTLLPVYVADYWGRRQEFAALALSLSARYISGLDENLDSDVIDDRSALPSLGLPALVIAGHHDFICGMRWARELRDLIPGSGLLVLERSGHFGHIEEPDAFAETVVWFVRSTSTGTA